MILLARLKRCVGFGLACCLLAALALRAQNAPEVLGAQQILKELEQIQKSRSGQFKAGLRQQVEELTAAAGSKSSAVALYEKAVLAVEYDGKPKDNADYAAWHEKHKEMLSDEDFGNALQLHLRYLVLSLERVDGQANEELMPLLLEYTAHLAAASSELIEREKEHNEKTRPRDKQAQLVNKAVLNAGRDILNKSLSSSVFVRWYRLEGHMSGLKDWEQSPGNIEGIIDKVVMPSMRAKKDARLIGLWDERIARAELLAHKTGLSIDFDKYQMQTLPALLWRKAQDRLLLGQRALALTQMLGVIKAYQSHQDFDKWVEELSDELKSEG